MYRGNFQVNGLNIDCISKVEEMLTKNWNVKELSIKIPTCDYLEISFVTENRKKIFKLEEILRYYKSDVYFWIDTVNGAENA
jgi:hypothetical protein